MDTLIQWFGNILDAAISIYFQQQCPVTSITDIHPPKNHIIETLTCQKAISFDERVILLLALMPHLRPQALDIFFAHNKNLDRPYTEFGGWKGLSHSGFLPTGQTAAFILAPDNIAKRQQIIRLFQPQHWFYTNNILRLANTSAGEPLLSGQLLLSEEFLCKVLHEMPYRPDYTTTFPAKLITTQLNRQDLVLDYHVACEIDEINTWIQNSHTIIEQWGLSRFIKAGYRSLFYGPPGTGKTLAATIIGKQNRMDIYRVDLSMIVSKYIGETEKNLAQLFDMAYNRNWILFFDEADALLGKRTATTTSNDRHANQEVAYLLQRIEDFPGTIILATNLRSNIDEAFSRRFQSTIYFPMPNEQLRAELWRKMLPHVWLDAQYDQIITQACQVELSGGAIANVVRRCALQMVAEKTALLDTKILKEAINKELLKS